MGTIKKTLRELAESGALVGKHFLQSSGGQSYNGSILDVTIKNSDNDKPMVVISTDPKETYFSFFGVTAPKDVPYQIYAGQFEGHSSRAFSWSFQDIDVEREIIGDTLTLQIPYFGKLLIGSSSILQNQK